MSVFLTHAPDGSGQLHTTASLLMERALLCRLRSTGEEKKFDIKLVHAHLLVQRKNKL
jgi:hypothetical protein